MTKILIADDAEDIRELLVFKLKAAGYDVYGVGDGESAVALAKSILPDVVVLDWMMPRMNGLDACVALRNDPNLHSVPIMFLTAKGQEIDVERGFTAGVDDYVVKPFSPRELVHRIEALLAHPFGEHRGVHRPYEYVTTMELSPRLIYALMFVIAGTLAVLAAVTTFVNRRRSWRDRRSAKLVAQLRPQVLEAIEGGPSPDLDGVRRGHETFIAIARSLLPTLRGGERTSRATRRRVRRRERSPARPPRSLRGAARARCGPSRERLGAAFGSRADPPPRRPRLRCPSNGGARARLDRQRRSCTRTVADDRRTHRAAQHLDDGDPAYRSGRACAVDRRVAHGKRARTIDLRGAARAARGDLRAARTDRSGGVGSLARGSDPRRRALGTIGAPGSVDALAAAMGRDQPVAVRAVATRALGRIGGRRTITLLRDALDAPEHVVAMNAAQALASIGDDGEEVLSAVAREQVTRRAGYAREGLSYISLTRSPALG